MKKYVLALSLVAVSALYACGDEEAKKPEEIVQQTIDFKEAASTYKVETMPYLTAFVEDVTLLNDYIAQNKVEEAAKLFPLIQQSFTRIQPLYNQFKTQFDAIEGDFSGGKALENGGLAAIEYALFTEQNAKEVKAQSAALVKDVTDFVTLSATTPLEGTYLLQDGSSLVKNLIEEQLSGAQEVAAFSQVYQAQGVVDALFDLSKSFEAHANKDDIETLTKQLNKTAEVIAFYEIGKEDYVLYNVFTNKQKQEMIQSFTDLQSAYNLFVKNMK